MKKISLITLVYNEEKNLPRYFSAAEKIDYPRENFEIVFVNDGSQDRSLEILTKWKKESGITVQIIDLKKNVGVAAARIEGVRAVKYDFIFFSDSKCEIFSDALFQINRLDYPLINANVLQKRDHIFDEFFAIVRRKFFPTSTGGKYPDIFITPKNFDSITKGGGVLFCEKTFFLESQFENPNDKNCSDDIRLIWNMVQKKEMLKTAKVNFYYNTRSSFWENIAHIFARGPKFIDYYFRPNRRYFWQICMGIFLFFLVPFLFFFFSGETIFLSIVTFLGISLFFGRNLREIGIIFFLFPLVSVVFFAGIVRGFFLKIFQK